MKNLTDSELENCRGSSLYLILAYLKKNLKEHCISYFLVFIAIGSITLDAYIVRHLVNDISTYKEGQSFWPIWRTLSYLIGVIILGNIGWRIAGYYVNPLFIRISGDVRHDLIRYLMKHSDNYFIENRASSMAYRTTMAGTSFNLIESSVVWSIYPQAVNLILSVGMLAIVNLYMTSALVIASAIICVILAKMAIKGRHLHIKHAELESHVNAEIQDTISHISLLRSFGRLKKERHILDTHIKSEMDSKWLSVKYMEKLRAVHSLFTMIMSSALLVTIIYLWQIHKATLGDVVLVTSLGVGIINSTRDLAISLVDVSQHFSKLSEALQSLLVTHEDKHEFPDEKKIKMSGDIRFEHIVFSYPNGKPVLNDFSLHIKSGENVGIVGLSGSGKSTILSLLQRNRYPQEGTIFIDDEKLNTISELDLRHNIAVVSQDVGLLYRSIRDNILIGKPDASDSEIEDALKASMCNEFIDRLPDGLDTLVGERGAMLSGGQRQRLAIARAFLKNAPILILDEATSALDNESERLIQDALMSLKKGRTVIAVAHRLSTLKDFDRIVVMDHGKIIQEGTMTELSKREGVFRDRLMIKE